ncbi:MAG: cytochrome P460 family protein [Anaerolineaceae bacterium]|nr:cytochrome P460 family protein [Anaerolineaceae bacterium]
MLNLSPLTSWLARYARFLLLGGVIVLLPLLLVALSPTKEAVTPSTPATPPAYSSVRLPENYHDTFVRYVRVDHRDQIIRDIFINPEVLPDVRPNRALPDGTVIVIEGYHAQTDANGEPLRDDGGRFVRGEPIDMIHVAEKRSNWQPTDFVGDDRSGNWNFASFDSITHQPFDEIMSRCFDCHNSTANTDFMYTFRDLSTFALTEDVQYVYCNLSGRSPC